MQNIELFAQKTENYVENQLTICCFPDQKGVLYDDGMFEYCDFSDFVCRQCKWVIGLAGDGYRERTCGFLSDCMWWLEDPLRCEW